MNNNFTELSEMELEKVIETAKKALREKKDSKRKETIAKIKALATSIGIDVKISEPATEPAKKDGKVPIKYQNPNNLSQTWTGRGMKPKWLQKLLDEGHQLENFEIKR